MHRVIFLLSMAVMLFSCKNPLDTSRAVRYEVTGNCQTADVTYENSSGSTSQNSDVTLPWEYDFNSSVGTWVYISAQAGEGHDTTSVTVTIYVDDQKWLDDTDVGAYCIATAHGTLE